VQLPGHAAIPGAAQGLSVILYGKKWRARSPRESIAQSESICYTKRVDNPDYAQGIYETMFNLQREIEELLEKYPDPRKGADGIREFYERFERDACLPMYGNTRG
jgi:hypothetical protein